jgi:deferrochelatase/peroxidase EfeB
VLPDKDVGLLFMAFNASIVEQFEFLQARWAGSQHEPIVHREPTFGIDQIAGVGARGKVAMPDGHGGIAVVDAFPQTVTVKGGEYFFAPSLPFLRGLDRAPI